MIATLLAQNVANMAGPYLVKVGIDRGIPAMQATPRDTAVLVATTTMLLVAAGVEYCAKRWFTVLSGRLSQLVLFELRVRVYNQFQRLSVEFHQRYTAGRMISRLTNDIDSIAELAEDGLGDLALAAMSAVSVAAMLVWLDPVLAAVTLTGFPLLAWLTLWYRRGSIKAYRRTGEAIANVVGHLVESMSGVRAVQAFRAQRRNDRIFERLNDEFLDANTVAWRLVAVYGSGIQLIGNLTVAAVLAFGGYRVLHGEAEIGVLAAYLLYLRRFFEPIAELGQFYTSLQSATAALEKLADVLAETPSVPRPRHPVRIDSSRVRGELRMCDVRFGYPAAASVLHGIDLLIAPGETVALVGATGAGKTTVARLFARFYDPGRGAVYLDQVDLRLLAEEDLRRAVVMVTQENVLFTGSVLDNIGFGRPGAAHGEIVEAATAVGADGFIRALPAGYLTEISDRGGPLSSGQRQLIAFARAFLADPAVLILDEATSCLDIPAERLVQRALRTVLANRTAIVIAHRLSTVEIADRVLVLDNGTIVEEGPPHQLIKVDGPYASMHRQWRDSLI